MKNLYRMRRLALLCGLALLGACGGSDDSSSPSPSPSASPSPSPSASPSPSTGDSTAPTSGTRQFVNSPDQLDGSLAENYVDFSFSYPAHWTPDPAAGKPGASNFAKVSHDLEGGYTVENFAVGYFASSGSAEGDAALFPQLADQLSRQFAGGFPGYRKLAEGNTRIGSLDGYELRFESKIDETPKGPITIWGRAVMVPVAGSSRGITVIMLATSLSPEIKGSDDVGVKGELPVILDSLKIGK